MSTTPVPPRSPRRRSPVAALSSLALVLALGSSLTSACAPAATKPDTEGPTTTPPAPAQPAEPVAVPGSFADNPIVYFVVTDRFLNGNPGNDNSYGRRKDGGEEIGTFHGGDLAGLTAKLEEGYFRDLGVNGIWITAPYEQIRGWVVGGDKEFQHYAYHGYYALDFTVLDQNMGTESELRAFVDAAHAQGIRVIFDIVMNHPGYADLWTLNEFGIDVLWDGWEKATPADYHSYIDYNDFDFTQWWGGDWVRSGLPGYDEGSSWDDLTKQLAFLPDFKTESDQAVKLPAFLTRKPDTHARAHDGYTVRAYLVEWLTRWVREFGVDGFRCDTAKHVDLASWAALKAAGVQALAAWKREHPDRAVDDAPFWMTGEVFPHGVQRDDFYDQGGFDNLINFDFQNQLDEMFQTGLGKDWRRIDTIYADYASKISSDPTFNVLTYISSHDTKLFNRRKLIPAGTALLLAPGGVQIFYGDESARPAGPVPSSDPQQATRSDMNWGSVDAAVLAHWQTLGRFRSRHVAVAKGAHQMLAERPYTFSRIHPEDRVVAAIGATGEVTLPVGEAFVDGARVRDAVTGTELTVTGGRVTVVADASGVVLLEAVRADH
ncbi:alpha-amylase family glycosyl hydrolase [Haliangium sp.]|uniref:alpha-amylase family glycosyl hydrolase n=1 Tax=Haliangium sp. TaxID=2663208 RepID=UPI003D0E9291